MREINIVAKINICSYGELNEYEKKLVDAAKSATENAYAPYSGFNVGAAVLLENNTIITGNNQENVAYPSGLCAERIALFYANSQYPDQAVQSIAVAAFTKDRFTRSPITPCGACRQVMIEIENRFRRPVRILLYGEDEIYVINGIRDLLPLSFNTI